MQYWFMAVHCLATANRTQQPGAMQGHIQEFCVICSVLYEGGSLTQKDGCFHSLRKSITVHYVSHVSHLVNSWRICS